MTIDCHTTYSSSTRPVRHALHIHDASSAYPSLEYSNNDVVHEIVPHATQPALLPLPLALWPFDGNGLPRQRSNSLHNTPC